MSNIVCSSCGKTYNSFGILDGSAICNECFSEKNPDIPEQEDISNNDVDISLDSKLKSSYTSNTFIANTYIGLSTILFFINIIFLFVAAAVVGNFSGGIGLIVLIVGFIFTIVLFGISAIFAEIYRSLRGVEETLNRMNDKIKSPDKD